MPALRISSRKSEFQLRLEPGRDVGELRERRREWLDPPAATAARDELVQRAGVEDVLPLAGLEGFAELPRCGLLRVVEVGAREAGDRDAFDDGPVGGGNGSGYMAPDPLVLPDPRGGDVDLALRDASEVPQGNGGGMAQDSVRAAG